MASSRFFVNFFVLFICHFINAQQFTLEQTINLAKNQSPSYYIANNTKEVKYWSYRAYKAQFLPQLNLQGTLPDYTKTISQFVQPDGTYKPYFVNQNYSNLSLYLNQNVGLTGTRIFANTSLVRFDNFRKDLGSSDVSSQYTGSPFLIGVQQKLFGFIPLRWDKKIEPLKFEESKRGYVEDLENISVVATGRFFDLLLAQISLEIAEKNRANNDTIFKIAQGRYNLGKIGEDELLQLELTLMRANQEVSQAKLDIETTSLQLKRFIGLTDNQPIDLAPPIIIPNFSVDENFAANQAKSNRQNIIAFKRQLLEAQRGIAEARSSAGLNVDFFAQYGLSNQSPNIPNLYVNPNTQQNMNIGFTIPVVNWGRSQSLRKTAQANFELTKNNVSQAEQIFEQEVYTQVKQFKMLAEQLKITQKSSEIGQKRYDISKNRYLIGKIDITNLNIALQEKDQARRGYVQSLRQYWIAYFTLRKLTLYDFQNQISLLNQEK